MAKKRIVINVEYDDEHEIPTDGSLYHAVFTAIGLGLLTDDSSAVVESWDAFVDNGEEDRI